MEVSLRKPQRIVFEKINHSDGRYLRGHRKSGTSTRLYWRLMTKDHSPIANFTAGTMKPFFQLSLLRQIGEAHWALKEDITLAVKKPKKKK